MSDQDLPKLSSEVEKAKKITKENINPGQLDTLICLVESRYVFDGDIPSKTARNELVENGLAERCRHPNTNEEGYQRPTPEGINLYMDYYGKETLSKAKAERLKRFNTAFENRNIGRYRPSVI